MQTVINQSLGQGALKSSVCSFSGLDAVSDGGLVAAVWEISSQYDASHHGEVLLLFPSWFVRGFPSNLKPFISQLYVKSG